MARPSQAKENLIKAATDLIWEHSYGSTSVDDICARAEVRKGSFYHFFEYFKLELKLLFNGLSLANNHLPLHLQFTI